MFTPSSHSVREGPALGTRSRRRQRPSSTDNLHQQPKAKKQRNERQPLTETTFVPVNPINPEPPIPANFEVKPTRLSRGESMRQDGPETVAPASKKEIILRSKKHKAVDRTSKGDGSVVLTTNNAYFVSKLAALPDRLRTDANCRNHGTIDSSGYALSLSHTHAIVWPYTSHLPSPETFAFALPYPSGRASDPLPLGALVAGSASTSEPGLVIVMPVSGKITYWESISSAATLDLIRQQRNGVEDSIPGMFHGETVIQILNAEPAGLILAFSTGRVAHMNVRDTQGRPAVSVHFLRGYLGSGPTGIFGSIRTVFTQAGGRGEIASVRCDRSPRTGERVVVAASSRGKLHGWKVQRTGTHDTLLECETRDVILNNIQAADPERFANYSPESFEIVDFTFAPKGLDAKHREMTRLSEATSSDDSIQQLVVLTSLTNQSGSYYCLCELVLSANSFMVAMVRPISAYSTPVSNLALGKPRIYVPKPALVAYLVFDRAVVVASIAALPESPDAQIQEDNHRVPSTYEDIIDLQQDNLLEIVASGFEEPHQDAEDLRSHRFKTKNPAVVLYVRGGAGVLRVSTTDIEKFASEVPPKVTARSKLEQAVMYGTNDNGLLTFSGRRTLPFTNEEICEAAIALSNDIVASNIPVLTTLQTCMESHMQARVEALNRLISHLNTMQVDLDRTTRWALMNDSEKMIIAVFLWKKHEEYTEQRAADGLDKKSLIAEIVDYIRQDQKNDPNVKAGEVDRVRHWFMHDVWRLEIFIAWAYEVVKYIYKDRLKDEANLTRYIYEAADVSASALCGALEYRQTRLGHYGLAGERIKDGILIDGHEGLPEPWTATQFITNNMGRTIELSIRWLSSHANVSPAMDKQLQAIRNCLPELTNQWLVSLQEYYRWASTPGNPYLAENPKIAAFAQECYRAYEGRHATIVKLVDYGLFQPTLIVAERHNAVAAMAEIMVTEYVNVKLRLSDHMLADSEIQAGSKREEELDALLKQCFVNYKEKFAFPAYDMLLRLRGVSAVLDFPPDTLSLSTSYLRTRPGLERISWINDVEKENDIDHAAQTLVKLGLSSEEQVWNKKIELSLGKLALMAEAAEETKKIDKDPFTFQQAKAKREKSSQKERQVSAIDDQLQLIKIQDSYYDMISPTIQTALDESAELQLAMEVHAAHIPKSNKALRQVFENSLGRVLKHQALDPLDFVDFLTLIALPLLEDGETGPRAQFYDALRVANLSLKGNELTDTRKLIWRRQYLRDDWALYNKSTDLQTDRSLDQLSKQMKVFDTCYLVAYNYPSVKDRTFYKPMMPTDVLGVYIGNLDRRFETSPSGQRNKILDAMKEEDTRLLDLVEHHRIDNWAKAIWLGAQGDAEKDLRRAGSGVDGGQNGNGNGAMVKTGSRNGTKP